MLVATSQAAFEENGNAFYTISHFTRWHDVITELYQLESSKRQYRAQVIKQAGVWRVIIGWQEPVQH